MKMKGKVSLFCFLVGLMVVTFSLGAHGQRSQSLPRVIVLGFDGVDPLLLEEFMKEGHLPNLARLKDIGSYRHLWPSNPAQSPVSWTCFSTGQNPAKTRIFDFLRRLDGSYFPDFALVKPGKKPFYPETSTRLLMAFAIGLGASLVLFLLLLFGLKRKGLLVLGFSLMVGLGLFFLASFIFLKYIPTHIPLPIRTRKGEPFWKLLGKEGIKTKVIKMPAAFPVEDDLTGCEVLASLGIPDMRQTNGTFSFYSTHLEEKEDTEMGGKLVPVTVNEGHIETIVYGPRNFTLEERPEVTPPLSIEVNNDAHEATIQFQGQEQRLKEGEWSRWFEFSFKLNPFIGLCGIGRFYLIKASPFQLYLSPINFHPAKLPSPFRISYPRDFAKELVKEVGLYKTLGWDVDTWALNEKRLDEKAFLEDLSFTLQKKKEMIFNQLGKEDEWRCFIGVFEEPDRLLHMFFRMLDKKHPSYDEDLSKRYAKEVLKMYEEMDEIVGKVMAQYLTPQTTLFVISDHGFKTWRKAVNVNTYLAKMGYLALKGEEGSSGLLKLDDLFGQGQFWPNVDWSKTQAYSLGLGQVFINLYGREPEGTVFPGQEYEEVRAKIARDLMDLTDPETGQKVFKKIYTRESIYHGPYLEEAADLILGYCEGYRTSWQTALGGIPKDVLEDNKKNWSGDHCNIDPSLTKGIFFCSKAVKEQEPSIMDMAPSILTLFGLPIPQEIDGKPLDMKGF